MGKPEINGGFIYDPSSRYALDGLVGPLLLIATGGLHITPERRPECQRPAIGVRFPLVILSHGYPGNRYLLSHFGENLASKGYVVTSIDHTGSTYADQAAFGSTLVLCAANDGFEPSSPFSCSEAKVGLAEQ